MQSKVSAPHLQERERRAHSSRVGKWRARREYEHHTLGEETGHEEQQATADGATPLLIAIQNQHQSVVRPASFKFASGRFFLSSCVCNLQCR